MFLSEILSFRILGKKTFILLAYFEKAVTFAIEIIKIVTLYMNKIASLNLLAGLVIIRVVVETPHREKGSCA